MTARLLPLREPVNADGAVRPVGSGVTIGHVHLKVADLERALAFYCGVLEIGHLQMHVADGDARPDRSRRPIGVEGLRQRQEACGHRALPVASASPGSMRTSVRSRRTKWCCNAAATWIATIPMSV